MTEILNTCCAGKRSAAGVTKMRLQWIVARSPHRPLMVWPGRAISPALVCVVMEATNRKRPAQCVASTKLSERA